MSTQRPRLGVHTAADADHRTAKHDRHGDEHETDTQRDPDPGNPRAGMGDPHRLRPVRRLEPVRFEGDRAPRAGPAVVRHHVPSGRAAHHTQARHQVEPGTRLVQTETFTGVLVPLLARSLNTGALARAPWDTSTPPFDTRDAIAPPGSDEGWFLKRSLCARPARRSACGDQRRFAVCVASHAACRPRVDPHRSPGRHGGIRTVRQGCVTPRYGGAGRGDGGWVQAEDRTGRGVKPPHTPWFARLLQ